MDTSNFNYYYLTDGNFKDLQILLLPLEHINTCTVGFIINAGSRDEIYPALGVAHFLEHMTFKGTKNRTSDELLNQLDFLGTKYNAYTSHENTAYYVSGNPTSIDDILEIVIDLFVYAKYPEEEIKKERNVVLEEYYMNQDSNSRNLINMLYKHIFQNINAQLAIPIIGSEESIKNLTRNDIIKFKKKNYTNKNSLLIIVGNFDKARIKHVLKNYFKSKMEKIPIKNLANAVIRNNNIIPLTSLHPDIKKNIYLHMDKEIKQTIVMFIFNGYNYHNYNNFYLDLITNILSTGMSSVLYKLLRGKLGITYGNSSYVNSFRDYGLLLIKVAVENENVLLAVRSILDELKNLSNNLNEKDLTRVKNQNKIDILFEFNNSIDYFMYYSNIFCNKIPVLTMKELIDKIQSVNLEDLKKIINKIFKKDNLIIGTIGPKSYPEIKEYINNFN